MCGAYGLSVKTIKNIINSFDIDNNLDNFETRWNIIPGQSNLIIINHEKKEIERMHWGLLPNFAKDEHYKQITININSEAVDELPTFRHSYAKNRCSGSGLWKRWMRCEILSDLAILFKNVASINKDKTLKTIRYLDISSLTEVKIDGYHILDISNAPSRARRIVKHNDVLISMVRPYQKHYGILKNPSENVIVSTGFCVIMCDKNDPHFVYIFLTHDEMTEYLHSIAEGSTSTYPSIKPSDIEDLEFQLPPQEKLDAFSEYACKAWNRIEYNHIQIRTLEKLRDTCCLS